MSDFVLSCCSTADLTREQFERRNIQYICFHYFMNDVEYSDDLYTTMTPEAFYQAMVDGADTRTSQVNISEYLDYFTGFLEQGKDILHLTLSSGISGSYTSAINAAAIARERYPDRKIYIVDSLAAASGFGLLMDKLADLRDQGMDIDQLHQWALDNRLRLHHWFFSTDLTFFVKGGRVSKVAGVFGGLLEICPLLNVSNEGRLIPREKIRTKKKVINAIVDKMVACADNGAAYADKCYICHSACREDAEAVASLVKDRFPNLPDGVQIYNIGTTIGSHTGPGTVALFFWGKERVD